MNSRLTSERLDLVAIAIALVFGLLVLLVFWLFYLGLANNTGFGSSGGISFIVLTAIEAGALVGVLAHSSYTRIGRRALPRVAIAAWVLCGVNVALFLSGFMAVY